MHPKFRSHLRYINYVTVSIQVEISRMENLSPKSEPKVHGVSAASTFENNIK